MQAIPSEVLLWCKVKQVVREGKPHREILSYAEEQNIDLICMGVRGAGVGVGAIFGEQTDLVMRQAPCPILVAHPSKSHGHSAGGVL
jgi:nucleotide-binding universal stress UspA family protein